MTCSHFSFTKLQSKNRTTKLHDFIIHYEMLAVAPSTGILRSLNTEVDSMFIALTSLSYCDHMLAAAEDGYTFLRELAFYKNICQSGRESWTGRKVHSSPQYVMKICNTSRQLRIQMLKLHHSKGWQRFFTSLLWSLCRDISILSSADAFIRSCIPNILDLYIEL